MEETAALLPLYAFASYINDSTKNNSWVESDV